MSGKNVVRPHETIYWRFGEQWAVRHGDHKLVVSKGGSGKPELYDLATDIGESKDLAGRHPDKVAELQKLYDAWSVAQAEPIAKDKPAAVKKVNKKKKAA